MSNSFKNKLEYWLLVKHPHLAMNIQKLQIWWEKTSWEWWMKLNRTCCEDTLAHHCAEKLAVNSKKACCWAYLPSRCETCKRRIPMWIRYKYMMLSSFLDDCREEQEKYEAYLKQEKQKRKGK